MPTSVEKRLREDLGVAAGGGHGGGLQRCEPAGVGLALGLLAVGAALRWGRIGGHWGGTVWIAVVKLMALPAIAWFVTVWYGLEGLERSVVVLFGSLPSASSAYILATRMGGDGPGVAWLISATTLAAMPTMALWLALLGAG